MNLIEALRAERVETARQRGERIAQERRERAWQERYGEPPVYRRPKREVADALPW